MASIMDRWAQRERDWTDARVALKADQEKHGQLTIDTEHGTFEVGANATGIAVQRKRPDLETATFVLTQAEAAELAAFIANLTAPDGAEQVPPSNPPFDAAKFALKVLERARDAIDWSEIDTHDPEENRTGQLILDAIKRLKEPRPPFTPTAVVLREIEAERRHQVDRGNAPDSDESATDGQLVRRAVGYALSAIPPGASEILVKQTLTEGRRTNLLMPAHELAGAIWPGHGCDFHPRARHSDAEEIRTAWPYALGTLPRRHDLVRGAALLVAEIERVDRGAEQGDRTSLMAVNQTRGGGQ